ncbi:hypothetical protein [Thauera sp. WH-1]|uniref:hypothetical protein n=1 Tax=Thauera sp. WH-1 TaxID=3398230 RepID=UPI0039FD52AE
MAKAIFPQSTVAPGMGTRRIKRSIGEQAFSDFCRSASILTSACAGAVGWSVDIHDAEAAASPSVLLYVWDSDTGWTWLCSVPRQRFAATSIKASCERPAVVDAIRGKLGNVIYRAATGAGSDPADEAPWEQVLGSMLAAYAGTTQAWAAAARLSGGGHFIVSYYRKSGEAVGMLRPFALSGDTRGRDVLPVERLLDAVRSVQRMDRERHPEWFA